MNTLKIAAVIVVFGGLLQTMTVWDAWFLLYIPLALILLPAIFLPTLVAERRKHRNQLAVTALNWAVSIAIVPLHETGIGQVLLIVGWVLALVWAFTANVEPTDQAAAG